MHAFVRWFLLATALQYSDGEEERNSQKQLWLSQREWICMYVCVCIGGLASLIKTIITVLFLFLSIQGHAYERFRFTTFYIYFALIIAELILSCFKEKPPFFSPVNTDPVSIFTWLFFCILQTISCFESSTENTCHWKQLWIVIDIAVLSDLSMRHWIWGVILEFEAFSHYMTGSYIVKSALLLATLQQFKLHLWILKCNMNYFESEFYEDGGLLA